MAKVIKVTQWMERIFPISWGLKTAFPPNKVAQEVPVSVPHEAMSMLARPTRCSQGTNRAPDRG